MAQIRLAAHAPDHLIGILQIGDVCCKTGDQTGSAVLVDVGKRKGLDVGVHSFSEVSGKAG